MFRFLSFRYPCFFLEVDHFQLDFFTKMSCRFRRNKKFNLHNSSIFQRKAFFRRPSSHGNVVNSTCHATHKIKCTVPLKKYFSKCRTVTKSDKWRLIIRKEKHQGLIMDHFYNFFPLDIFTARQIINHNLQFHS